MRYFDLVAYTATQVDSLNYSISLVPGYKDLPEDVDRCSMALLDSSGNSCQCWGKRVGSTFTIQTVRGSSAGLAPPSFPSGVELHSAQHAVDLELFNGLNGVWINGDSLAVGYTEGGRESDTGINDWIDPTVLMRGHSPAVSGDDSPMYTVLREPVRHSLRNEAVNDLSVALPLSHGLKQRGFDRLCILGNGQSSVGYSAYGAADGSIAADAPSGGNMERALNQAADFLSDGPFNSMLLGLFFTSTNDINYNTFQDHLDRLIWMATNYRTRLTDKYNQDFSRLPLVFVGQCAELLADPVTAGQNAGGLFNYEGAPVREQALAALPDYVPHTAYVDTAGLASHGDMFHYNADSYRELGGTRIPEAFYRALDNHNPVNMARSNDWVLEDAVSNMEVSTPNSVTMANVLENAASNMVVDVESLSNEVTMSNVLAAAVSSMSVDVTEPSSTPLLDAAPVTIWAKGNEGKTLNSTTVSGWQSVGTSDVSFVQANASRQPDDAATGATFGGGAQATADILSLVSPNLFKNLTQGATLIVDYTPHAHGGYLLGGSGNFIGMNTVGGSFFENVTYFCGYSVGGGVNAAKSIGDRHSMVLTLDSTSGLRVDIDGVTDYEAAGANPVSSNPSEYSLGGWLGQANANVTIHNLVILDASGYLDKTTTDAYVAELQA